MGEFDAEPVFTGTGVSYRCPQCKMVVPPGKVGHVCSVPLDTGPVITGARIRARRVSAGMYLGDLAKALDVGVVTISDIERGRQHVTALGGSRCSRLLELFPGIDAPEDPIAERWIADGLERARRREGLLETALLAHDREVHPKDWSPLPGVPMEKVTKPFDVYPETDYEALGYPETRYGHANIEVLAIIYRWGAFFHNATE